MIKSIIDTKSKLVFLDLPKDDPKIRKPDIKLAQKLLGWSPKINIIEGLKKTLEYY